MTALLLVLALQAPTDEAKLAEWIVQLAEDDIELREKAEASLVQAGRRAEQRLREALKHPNEEVRARAVAILAAIEKAEGARRFEAGPSLITLRKKDAPLREVLEEMEKQTATRLSWNATLRDARVTVAFEKTPLLKAVEELCAGHGGMRWRLENRTPGAILWVEPGRVKGMPRAVVDQYLVRLTGVSFETRYDLEGGCTSQTRLDFQWGWEQGTRPSSATVQILDVVDDAGTSYAGDLREVQDLRGRRVMNPSEKVVMLSREPAPGVLKLALVKGVLDLEFPQELRVYGFDSPEEKCGVTVKQGDSSLRLISCSRARDKVRARFEQRTREGETFESRAVTKDGKEFLGRLSQRVMPQRADADESAMEMTVDFTVPEGAALASLRLEAPAGVREKRVPFELRELPVRAKSSP